MTKPVSDQNHGRDPSGTADDDTVGPDEDVGADTGQFQAFVERRDEPRVQASATAVRLITAIIVLAAGAAIVWVLLR